MVAIYFLYGLSYFSLGIAVAAHPKRGVFQVLSGRFWLFAGFGLLHGVHDWVEMLFQGPHGDLGPALPAISVGLAAASWILLMAFGAGILASLRRPSRAWYAPVAVFPLAWALASILLRNHDHATSITTRYFLGASSSLLTAGALFLEARSLPADARAIAPWVSACAGLVLLHGVLSGLIVPPSDFLPASVFNTTSFAATFGVPVQIPRALVAVGLALSVLRIMRIIGRHREEALLRSEERYRSLVELSPDGIGLAVDGRVVFLNAAGRAMLGGGTMQDFAGRSVMDFIHPEEREQSLARFLVVARERRPIPFADRQFVRPDGTSFPVELAAAPIFHTDGPGIQVVFRDISSRKKAEEEIELYHGHLEEMVKERTKELQKALDDVKMLAGLVPICAWCQKIRDDKGYWARIEAFLAAHTGAKFTHGICPECEKRMFPAAAS